MEGPGFLAVAIQPGWNTDEHALDTWYNEEHGPLRLRLPFIETGDRYKAADGQKPTWMAVYDVSELSWLDKRIYTRLREERSMREKAVMGTFESIDRKIYSIISTRGAYQGPAPVILAVSMRLHDTDLAEFNTWYEREHTDLLSKIPGWIRTRRYKMVAGGAQGMPSTGEVECLAVHEFRADNGLHGPEHKSAQQRSSQPGFMEKVLWKEQRMWIHHLSFAPLAEPRSSVLTTDSAELHYQMDGNPNDPVVVCVNPILTSLHIWDDLTTALISGATGRTYRVLRYNPRGLTPLSDRSNRPSFDLLADDLEYLLSRLHCARAHAVIGVSMGAVTALAFALRHPALLDRYVACGCAVASTPASVAAWPERIELAKGRGMPALADAAVDRWFPMSAVSSSKTSPARRRATETARSRVRPMVAAADLEGFELGARALCDYDLRPGLGAMAVPGLLLVGEEDEEMLANMTGLQIARARLVRIPEAGHLPMLDNHQAFVEALAGFL